MKKIKEIMLDAIYEYFAPLIVLFSSKGCDCPKPDEEAHGELAGAKFKKLENGRIYQFLFTARCEDNLKDKLIVIYQDIESGNRFCSDWNFFFSSTKVDGQQVPRFEELK